MKGTGDLKVGGELDPQGKGSTAGAGSGASNSVPKAVESHAVFDQAMARIMGSRLGVYDGQDWAGHAPEDRHQIGEQMLEEATRLRETGRLVEGLALAIKIGKEQPLEPSEAVSQLRSGIDGLGPSEASGMGSLSGGLGHEGNLPTGSPGSPLTGSFHPAHQDPPAVDAPEPAVPGESLDQVEQLGFEGWVVTDQDDLEA